MVNQNGHHEIMPQTNENGMKTVHTMEQSLQPLINQLSSLTTNGTNSCASSSNSFINTNGHNHNNTSNNLNCTNDSISNGNGNTQSRRKGRSKRAHTLVESVIDAIENFIRQGVDIAQESIEMRDELMQAISDIRKSGSNMAEASRDFANEPLVTQKRINMIKASRDLLGAIATLLTIADVIDVNQLIKVIQLVQNDLSNLKNASNQDELTHYFKSYGKNLIELTNLAGKRQADLKDIKLRDELASARACLKKHSLLLLTASKVI
jgi:hypothetical protein